MKIQPAELDRLVLGIAKSHYGDDLFDRRSLMNDVEREVRDKGLWEVTDNVTSKSAGIKSKGLARIDWAISRLKRDGRLINTGRNLWKIS